MWNRVSQKQNKRQQTINLWLINISARVMYNIYGAHTCKYLVGGGGGGVQLLSHVWLFATPWTTARQASLSFTNSQTFKLMSIESVIPPNHLILCCSLLLLSIFPSTRVFSNESALGIGGQSIGASASASDLPMKFQDWFSFGLTGLFSLQSKCLSWVFSGFKVQKHKFFSNKPSLWSNSHIHRWLLEKLALTVWPFVGKVMSLLFNTLSRYLICCVVKAFLPRSKHF